MLVDRMELGELEEQVDCIIEQVTMLLLLHQVIALVLIQDRMLR